MDDRRDEAPPQRGDLHLSEREREIIETAAATAPRLPELHAAGRMFFRFDPGFRFEVESARRAWSGSAAPLSVDGLSEQRRHNLRAWLHSKRNRGFRSIGIRLATRWDLDLDSTLDAIAFDTAPRYPFAEVRPWETDPETGYHYAELRVYSAKVWNEVWKALMRLGMADRTDDQTWFWDRPEGSRERLRGKDARGVVRTLAIHFLMRAPTDRRPTGGERTWEAALRLWEAHAPSEMPGLSPESRSTWSEDRTWLLRSVFGRCQSPIGALRAEQVDRVIGDHDWATELGITTDAWQRIRADEQVDRAAWDRVKRARPALAADIDAYLEYGLLTLGEIGSP